jgi:hypothetical protein
MIILLLALPIFLFGVLVIAVTLNIRHSRIPLKKRLRCWIMGHVWFEHWKAQKIDHCVKCELEKPHPSEGCTCTVCTWPGGLEKWVEWVQETSQAAQDEGDGLMEAPRRWPHPHDLKPEFVHAFLKTHEPRVDHSGETELLRVLCWALPLYAKTKPEKIATR